jgi:hypothetical protein
MVDGCRYKRCEEYRPYFHVYRPTYSTQAISDLFKSITALPTDTTLISLAPAPLLECVCRAAQHELTAIWLSLANTLIMQLNPFSNFKSLRPAVDPVILTMVKEFTGMLLETTLGMFNVPGKMQEVGRCL